MDEEKASVLVSLKTTLSKGAFLLSTDGQPIEVDFWGQSKDVFVSMRERYGVWPTTVIPIDLRDEEAQELKALLNEGTTRVGSLQVGYMNSKSCYKNPVSIFNPSIATYLLNLFAPQTGRVFDPFAGGGTRAIMCAKRGLRYVGIELRLEEVQEVRKRVELVGVSELVNIIHGDSTKHIGVGDRSCDFLITCPPYYNLEEYGGGEGDLSGCGSYKEFLLQLSCCVRECYRILRPGAKSVWVVGLHRDEEGTLLPLNHDITLLHRNHGFKLQEEIILKHENNGSIQRVGQFDKGKKRLVRVHEYALVFQKPEC